MAAFLNVALLSFMEKEILEGYVNSLCSNQLVLRCKSGRMSRVQMQINAGSIYKLCRKAEMDPSVYLQRILAAHEINSRK